MAQDNEHSDHSFTAVSSQQRVDELIVALPEAIEAGLDETLQWINRFVRANAGPQRGEFDADALAARLRDAYAFGMERFPESTAAKLLKRAVNDLEMDGLIHAGIVAKINHYEALPEEMKFPKIAPREPREIRPDILLHNALRGGDAAIMDFIGTLAASPEKSEELDAVDRLELSAMLRKAGYEKAAKMPPEIFDEAKTNPSSGLYARCVIGHFMNELECEGASITLDHAGHVREYKRRLAGELAQTLPAAIEAGERSLVHWIGEFAAANDRNDGNYDRGALAKKLTDAGYRNVHALDNAFIRTAPVYQAACAKRLVGMAIHNFEEGKSLPRNFVKDVEKYDAIPGLHVGEPLHTGSLQEIAGAGYSY